MRHHKIVNEINPNEQYLDSHEYEQSPEYLQELITQANREAGEGSDTDSGEHPDEPGETDSIPQ